MAKKQEHEGLPYFRVTGKINGIQNARDLIAAMGIFKDLAAAGVPVCLTKHDDRHERCYHVWRVGRESITSKNSQPNSEPLFGEVIETANDSAGIFWREAAA